MLPSIFSFFFFFSLSAKVLIWASLSFWPPYFFFFFYPFLHSPLFPPHSLLLPLAQISPFPCSLSLSLALLLSLWLEELEEIRGKKAGPAPLTFPLLSSLSPSLFSLCQAPFFFLCFPPFLCHVFVCSVYGCHGFCCVWRAVVVVVVVNFCTSFTFTFFAPKRGWRTSISVWLSLNDH